MNNLYSFNLEKKYISKQRFSLFLPPAFIEKLINAGKEYGGITKNMMAAKIIEDFFKQDDTNKNFKDECLKGFERISIFIPITLKKEIDEYSSETELSQKCIAFRIIEDF